MHVSVSTSINIKRGIFFWGERSEPSFFPGRRLFTRKNSIKTTFLGFLLLVLALALGLLSFRNYHNNKYKKKEAPEQEVEVAWEIVFARSSNARMDGGTGKSLFFACVCRFLNYLALVNGDFDVFWMMMILVFFSL